VGVYAAVEKTGKALRDIIADTLIRLNLDLCNMRGQTYDGAATMAGQYNGCQALIRQENELGSLAIRSGKFKTAFVSHAAEAACSCHNLRPLCPPRYVVRVGNIRSVLAQYELILDTLEDFCTSSPSVDVKIRANELHGRFVDGNTPVCLHIALAVFEPLENLCTALQRQHVTV
jgi:hypothetical protein